MEKLKTHCANDQIVFQNKDAQRRPTFCGSKLFTDEIDSKYFVESNNEEKANGMAVTNDEWNSVKERTSSMEINKCQADNVNKNVHNVVENEIETSNLNHSFTSTSTKTLENGSSQMNEIEKASPVTNCINSECLKCSHCLKTFRNKRKLKTHLYLCHCITENMVSMQDNLFPTHEPVHSTSESDNEVCDLMSNGQNSVPSIGEVTRNNNEINKILDSGNSHSHNERKQEESSFIDSVRELEAANTLIDLQLQNSGVPFNAVIDCKESRSKVIYNDATQDPMERNNPSVDTLQRSNGKISQIIENVDSKTNTPLLSHDALVQRANVIVFSKTLNNDNGNIQSSECNSLNSKSENNERSNNQTDSCESETDSSVSKEIHSKDEEFKDVMVCDARNTQSNDCIDNTSSEKCMPLLPIPFSYPVIGSSPGGNITGQDLMEFQNGIRIDCETALVTKLECIHPATKQLYVLYKCCLCGNAFSGLAALRSHVGNHGNSNKENNCGKCGATFKCHGQLELHDQLHQAIENKTPVPLNPGLFINPFGMLSSQMDDLTNQGTSSFSNFAKLDPYWSMLQRIYAGYPGNLYSSLSLGGFPLLEDNQQSLLNKLIDTKETKSRSSNKTTNKVPMNKPVYQCSYCPKVFDRVFSLQRHERVHTGIKPCSCKICGRGFSEKRNLRHHVIRFHSDSNRKELLWRAHRQKTRLKNPHGPKKLVSFLKRAATCILNSMGHSKLDSQDDSSDACTEDIKVPELLQLPSLDGAEKSISRMTDDAQMSSTVNENKSSLANVISSNFGRHLAYLSRDSQIHESAQITDPLMTAENINPEINTHSPVMPSGDQLKQSSVNIPQNEQTYLLNDSQRTESITSPVPRNDNELSASVGNKYSYPCNYCSKSFCSTSDLKRHMDFHKDIRPYKCPSCEYRSRTNSQLKVHMMRHQGIRQFLCHPCNYGGVTQSDLNRHLKTRTHILRTRAVCSS